MNETLNQKYKQLDKVSQIGDQIKLALKTWASNDLKSDIYKLF